MSLVVPLAASEETGRSEVEQQVEEVVQAMNRAISERDLRTLLEQFADGAVQLNLAAAHPDAGGAEMVADLAGQWKAIAPILFANTESYTRVVEEMATHVDGALASVWARVRTETKVPEQEPTTLEFSETYLLSNVEGTWKILAVTNNRPTR